VNPEVNPPEDPQRVDDSTAIAPSEPIQASPLDRVFGIFAGLAEGWKRLPPTQWVAQTLTGWFSVSDAQVAEILQQVRAELPTTEALLLGKPQAGKSSIVRGLTGVSAEIVGQGFKPHTRYTQRYSYPTVDLPLLVFTDTVGLGDVTQDTAVVVKDLLGELAATENRCARVLLLTVKINDFATDTLRQIVSQIRQQHPAVPCLLVVTCLHELYPPDLTDHPPYPPT